MGDARFTGITDEGVVVWIAHRITHSRSALHEISTRVNIMYSSIIVLHSSRQIREYMTYLDFRDQIRSLCDSSSGRRILIGSLRSTHPRNGLETDQPIRSCNHSGSSLIFSISLARY